MMYFKGYLDNTDILNHLDISGMNFDQENLIKIVASLADIGPLVGVHLSDLGISTDEPIRNQILEILGVEYSKYGDCDKLLSVIDVSSITSFLTCLSVTLLVLLFCYCREGALIFKKSCRP